MRGVIRWERTDEEGGEIVFMKKTPKNKVRYNRDIGFQ
jgi:hypothetical protein